MVAYPDPAQVIFALPSMGDTDFTMRIYNSDGSEPEMCGNGIRCLARFVNDVDKASPRKYKIHTLAGGEKGMNMCKAIQASSTMALPPLQALSSLNCSPMARSAWIWVSPYLRAHGCPLHLSPQGARLLLSRSDDQLITSWAV